jgi:hypothetical protein
VAAVKVPDELECLFGELATYMHAKDEKGIRRVFRELLDTGRSRAEIMSEVIRLLDKNPSAADQRSNGTGQHRLTEPKTSVGPSQVERHQSPMAWPDIAPQFSTGAADRKALSPSSEQVPLEPGFWQETSRDQQEHPNASQSESSPYPVLEPNSNPGKGASAKGQANESTRGPSSAKNEAEPYLPALEKESPATGQTKKSRRPRLAKGRAEASISSPEATPARAQASRGTRAPSRPTEHVSTPQNATPKGGEASKSTSMPNATKNGVATDVPTESAIRPRAPLNTSPPTASRGKNGVEAYVSTARPDPSDTRGLAERVGDNRQDMATDGDVTSSPEKPLGSFFANTSPRQVGLRSDSTRETVPERLTAKLYPQSAGGTPEATKEAVAQIEDAAADSSRLALGLQQQSSGTSSAEPGTMKKPLGAQTKAPPANGSDSPKAHWRPSPMAVRLLTVASLLIAAMGGSYVLWDFYGNELEQTGVASARSARTWLQDIRSSGLLRKREAVTTVEKTVDPQPTEAPVVTTVPQNARTEQTTLPGVAAPIPEDGPPKPRDGSIGTRDASQPLNNLGVPSASSPTELSPSATKRGEPDANSRSARTKGVDKNAALNAIPPTKPTPPDTQGSLSSGTTPRSVTSADTSEGKQSPPVSAASQAVASIDVAGLVTRGDQLLATRDVASARLFYERAAQAGDGQGALRMGMTFDPAFLDRSGFRSVRGDPAQAVSWYNRAAALGNSAAEELRTMLTSSKK